MLEVLILFHGEGYYFYCGRQMKDRALPSLILRGPVALGKGNTGGGLKSFLTLSKL